MNAALPTRLDPPVGAQDHSLGDAGAQITLVEYGSYNCPSCHKAHDIIANLRDRFGDRLRYVWRHRPITSRARSPLRASSTQAGQLTRPLGVPGIVTVPAATAPTRRALLHLHRDTKDRRVAER